MFEPGARPENTFVRYLIPATEGPVNPVVTEAPDPRANSEHLMEVAAWLETDQAAITDLRSDFWVSATAEEDAGGLPAHAIALLKQTTRRRSRAAVTSAQQEQLARTELALVACMLANYIRELGFPARAHHVGDGRLLVAAVAVAAGLGAMTAPGRFVSHRYGPEVCLATVTTAMPLVVMQGSPHRRRRRILPPGLRARR